MIQKLLSVAHAVGGVAQNLFISVLVISKAVGTKM